MTVEEMRFCIQCMDVLPTPIIICDSDNKLIYINQAYSEWMSVNSEDVLGKDIQSFLPNTNLPDVIKRGEAMYALTFKYINGKNKGKEVIGHAIPVFDEQGRAVAAIGTHMFVSQIDIKALSIKNKKLYSELEFYKNEFIRNHGGTKYDLSSIIGSSERMQLLKRVIQRFAPLKQTILITGESGCGKELIAHSIHACSTRSNKSFLRVNCAAIPENLFESEFFGYEAGSFTGASKSGKAGKFEMAKGGTIFLDEIGELPMFMQSKLLRVLQEKEITRVGGDEAIPIDVRIVAATNKDLWESVENGSFRKDLFYRINILHIKAPALREHREDIPELVENMLDDLYKENGMKKYISEGALNQLMKYAWSGNVRELNNVISRMYFMSETNMINTGDIPNYILKNTSKDKSMVSDSIEQMDGVIESIEKQMVKNMLKETKGNLSKTAELLGISRTRLYRIIEKIKIDEKG